MTMIMAFAAGCHSADDVPAPPLAHETLRIEGWTIHVDDRSLLEANPEDAALGKRARFRDEEFVTERHTS